MIKYLAKYYSGNEWKMIDIYDAISREENENKAIWNNIKFYTMDKKHELNIVHESKDDKKAHFRYKKVPYFENQGSDNSITHETYMDIIATSDKITLVDRNNTNKKIIIDEIVEANCEVRYDYDNDNFYLVDVQIKFNKSIPEEYVNLWNGIFILEVYFTHKVDSKKQQYFIDKKITVVEHKVSQNFTFEDISDANEFRMLEKQVRKFVKENLYVSFLSEHDTKENQLKSTIKRLENEKSEMSKKLKECSQEIKKACNERDNAIKNSQEKIVSINRNLDNEKFKNQQWHNFLIELKNSLEKKRLLRLFLRKEIKFMKDKLNN